MDLCGAVLDRGDLQDFFGTDDVSWTDTNNGGLTRSFTHFSQAIEEIDDARVWSGIHFRSAPELRIVDKEPALRNPSAVRIGAINRFENRVAGIFQILQFR